MIRIPRIRIRNTGGWHVTFIRVKRLKSILRNRSRPEPCFFIGAIEDISWNFYSFRAFEADDETILSLESESEGFKNARSRSRPKKDRLPTQFKTHLTFNILVLQKVQNLGRISNSATQLSSQLPNNKDSVYMNNSATYRQVLVGSKKSAPENILMVIDKPKDQNQYYIRH